MSTDILSQTTLEAPKFDLLDGAFYDAPNDAYRWLRDNAPVYWDDVNRMWALTRYEDILFAEKHPELFSSDNAFRPRLGEMRPEDAERVQSMMVELMGFAQSAQMTRRNMMIDSDDPAHAQMRKCLNGRFTPKAVAEHEAEVRSVIGKLLDAVADKGRCDLASEVAAWVPVIVIGDMLGFAPEDRPILRRCADLGNEMGTGPGSRYMSIEGLRAVDDFRMAAERTVEQRRREPRGDLISVLVQAEFDGERLNDTEIFNELLLLNDGGADTTRYVINGGVKALLDHPDQRQAFVDHPELRPAAVEECLRWTTPIVNMARMTTQDVELQGVTIPKGDGVLLLYGGANQDDRVFDEPEKFDIGRTGKHLAFGFGTHFCLGAHLARLEVRVALEEILRRLPDMALDGDTSFSPTAFVRGIDHLPVRWSTS